MKLKRLKTFDTSSWYVPFVEQVEPKAFQKDNGVRFYQVGNEAYPSITSVLGYYKRKGIMEWRARVGEEEANKISGRASRRGTIIHNMIEKYLNNEDMSLILEKRNPLDQETFAKLLPTLSRIDDIFLQECPLFSHRLGVAGRVDLGASFDGVPSIIDFKTSLREKREEYIQDYFEQVTAYALMHQHMTNAPGVKQVVVIMVNDESNEPQVFVKKPEEYGLSVRQKIYEYRKLFC